MEWSRAIFARLRGFLAEDIPNRASFVRELTEVTFIPDEYAHMRMVLDLAQYMRGHRMEDMAAQLYAAVINHGTMTTDTDTMALILADHATDVEDLAFLVASDPWFVDLALTQMMSPVILPDTLLRAPAMLVELQKAPSEQHVSKVRDMLDSARALNRNGTDLLHSYLLLLRGRYAPRPEYLIPATHSALLIQSHPLALADLLQAAPVDRSLVCSLVTRPPLEVGFAVQTDYPRLEVLLDRYMALVRATNSVADIVALGNTDFLNTTVAVPGLPLPAAGWYEVHIELVVAHCAELRSIVRALGARRVTFQECAEQLGTVLNRDLTNAGRAGTDMWTVARNALFGPRNPRMVSLLMNEPLAPSICALYRCPMFACMCAVQRDAYEPDTPPRLLTDEWFLGYCERCRRTVLAPCHAVRYPILTGGWVGCFCSTRCARYGIIDYESHLIVPGAAIPRFDEANRPYTDDDILTFKAESEHLPVGALQDSATMLHTIDMLLDLGILERDQLDDSTVPQVNYDSDDDFEFQSTLASIDATDTADTIAAMREVGGLH